MKLLIIGATGGTGRQVAEQALAQGHRLTALVRNPSRLKLRHEKLRVVQGNVLDVTSVEQAIQGQDAVICTLGHKRWFIPTSILSVGARNIVAAMQRHEVKRLICQTSLGVGNSRGKMGLYYTLFVIPVITFFYFRDKKKQEEIIRESGLDWTIVRPGQLTNGRKRGTYRHGEDIGNYILTVRISRADTAEFLLQQLTDRTYLHKSPGVAY